MIEWFRAKDARRFPVLGAVADDGTLLGFATYGTFRAWPAYKYTVEHSVYVHKDHRRKGIARALLTRLIAVAEEQDYHVMVGRHRRGERGEHRVARAARLRPRRHDSPRRLQVRPLARPRFLRAATSDAGCACRRLNPARDSEIRGIAVRLS